MKADYIAPHVKTEKVVMGVFGGYGGSRKPGKKRKKNFWNWLFGW